MREWEEGGFRFVLGECIIDRSIGTIRFGFFILGLDSKYMDLFLFSGKMILKDDNIIINVSYEIIIFYMLVIGDWVILLMVRRRVGIW